MSIPALANLALNLLLIPRLGLMGAVWATTISYGLGLAASILLGRRRIPLPLPLGTLWRSGAACLAMTFVVVLIPAYGGLLELAVKATAGAAVYGAVAFGLDAGGARTHSRRLVGALQGRIARA